MPDILAAAPSGPALSAVSDMPVIDPANHLPDIDQPVDRLDDHGEDSATSDKPEGEATDAPKDTSSEGKDVPPWVKGRLTAEANKRRAAEQKTAALEAEFAKLKESVEKLQPPAPEDNRPKRDSFTDPDAYEKALEDWAGRRAAERVEVQSREEARKQDQVRQFETARDTYLDRVTAFEKDHPDYADLVGDNEDLQISPAMTTAIMLAEEGPRIAYHLGQNPEMAARIAKLNPSQAAYEIGKIAASLDAPVRRPKPEPIRPIGARNGVTKSADEMSMDEYAAARTARQTH